MNHIFELGLAVFLGTLAASFFFGGLWWTTQKAIKVQRPYFFLLVSFLLRLGTVGVLFISFRDRNDELAAVLTGFILSRHALVRWLPDLNVFGKETSANSHAPQS